jgi:hypothetical protein
MMELSKKSLYQIKHLVRPFPEKAVRMIDHDHKTGVPISESDQVIQESDPWAHPPARRKGRAQVAVFYRAGRR